MSKFDNDKVLNIEGFQKLICYKFKSLGWSIQDRSSAVSLSLMSTIVAILCSIGLIIIPSIYFSQLPSWILICVGSSGLIGLITAIATLAWQRQQTKIFDLKEHEIDNNNTSHPYMDLIISIPFALNALMLNFNALFFIFSLVQFQFDRDYFAAQSSELQIPEFLFHFKLTGFLIIILLLIGSIAFGYNLFALYLAAVQQEHMRISTHIQNLFVLLTVLFVIFAAKQCLSFSKSQLVSSLVHLHYIHITIFIALIITIACLLVYAVNMKKQKVGYFFIGSLFLCILFINAGVHFKVYRDAVKIKETFYDDCGNQLRNTPEQFVLSDCYCQKYQKSLDCPVNQIAVKWENDIGKPVEEQVNHQACLNMNCCGTLAYSYSKWFYTLAFGSVALQIFGFGLVGVLYYLAQQPPFVSYKLYFSDFIFGGLITITLITGIILYSTKDFGDAIPPQNIIEVETLMQMPQTCSPLYMIRMSSFKCDNCDQVRISLYSDKADFEQSRLFYDNSKVKQIPSDLAAKQIFNAKGQVISLQGSLKDIIEAFKYVILLQKLIQLKVYFCPTTFDSSINVLLDFYQIGKLPSTTTQIQMTHFGPIQTTTQTGTTSTTNTASTGGNNGNASNGGTSGNSGSAAGQTKKSIPASIQLAKLNQIPFTNIIINAFNAFSLKSIPEFKTKLYVADQLYISLESDDSQVTFYNVPLQSYYLEVRNDNYFAFSKDLDLIDNLKPTIINATLIPALQKEGQLIFVLTWDNPSIQLGLASTFKQTTTIECTCGLILGTCDTMSFAQSNNTQTAVQTILFDGMKDFNYLIYVQYFPLDKNMIKLNEQVQAGKQISDEDQQTIKNDDFFNVIQFETKITLSVYSQGLEKPIFTTNQPVFLESMELHEPNLTWLALCLNGKIGTKSLASPSEFWNYAKSSSKPQFYERNNGDQRALPTGVICEEFYKNQI